MPPFSTDHEFTAYGPSHRVVLAVFAAGVVAAVSAGRAPASPTTGRGLSRAFAAVVLVVQLAVHIYLATPPRWNIQYSLPLQLSDLAGFVAAYALWSHRGWAFSLTYYWGLTLSVQALITPVLRIDFPHLEFWLFWTNHLFVVWAAVYLTWGLGMRPGWRDYRLVVMITACWMAVVFGLNTLLGSNYGYLNRKPATGSVLDLLGEWPWYLLPEAALVFGVWALMTWPWTRHPTRI